MVPEPVIWKIWRCIVGELVPAVSNIPQLQAITDMKQEEAWEDAPASLISSPDTIWQSGKCIFHVLAKGRFFDGELNTLQLIDNGEKFGAFKVSSLHGIYSQNLLRTVLSCFAYVSANRPTRTVLMKHFGDVLSIFARGSTKGPGKDHLTSPSDNEKPYQPRTKGIPAGLPKARVQSTRQSYEL